MASRTGRRTIGRTTTPEAFVFARREWRRGLAGLDQALTERLLAAYGTTLQQLAPHHQALTADLLRLWDARGGNITAEDVRGLPTYGRLMARIEAEMMDFASMARRETEDQAERAVASGLTAAETVLEALQPGIVGQMFRPAPEALQRLLAYTDSSAFLEKWRTFGENTARMLGDVYLMGVAQGRNPRELARLLERWTEVPRAWALNSARTTIIWSYRTANHEYYRRNPGIVSGWMWSAACDSRTCPACWGMDGTLHDLEETLNGHHQCRCAPVPVVSIRGIGSRMVEEYGEGWQKFEKLSATDQYKVLGPTRFKMLQAVRTDQRQPRGVEMFWTAQRYSYYEDAVFGKMHRAPSIAEMRGSSHWERAYQNMSRWEWRAKYLEEYAQRQAWAVDKAPGVESYAQRLFLEGTSSSIALRLKQLEQLPEGMMDWLVARGATVRISDGFATELPGREWMINEQPRGWGPGFTFQDVPAFYDRGTKEIVCGKEDEGYSLGTVLGHEVGHAWGHATGYEDRKDFIEMHREQFRRLTPYLRQGGPGAASGRQEYFAELFSSTVWDRKLAVLHFGKGPVSWMEARIEEWRNPP